MRLPPRRLAGCAAILAALAWGGAAPARAQAYATMAGQPDPRDFVTRADTQLTLLGRPVRFGGVTIPWLGMRTDGHAPARRPTPFEVRDALKTAEALGAAVVRLPGLASTAGCALCLEPTPGQMNPEVFAQIDLVLKTARDLGLKVILPLADSGRGCADPAPSGVICRAAPGPAGPHAFFTDAGAQAAFTARVRTILAHVNSLTNVAYASDSAILAWEDCDACAGSGDDPAVAAWVARLGQTIHAADTHHLFESGAFAGRIGPAAANAVQPASYAPDGVDIVGDRPAIGGAAAAAREALARQVAAIGKANRAYVLDDVGWSPALWPTEADLEAWLGDIVRERQIAVATVGNLQAHADQGGYLPPGPATGPGLAALYFPGFATPDVDAPTMQTRGRALRRFNFAMAGITLPPAYLLTPQPDILAVQHGRVSWRGAAGAASYSIERSPDPSTPGSWTLVCDACASDATGFWQDPAPAAGQDWYRVMPLNINGHRAVPSTPAHAR